MRKIKFCDTTLRDGEQTPGVHFGAAEKLEIAKRLQKTGIDVIEAGFPASSEGDFAAVRGIAEKTDICVSALARLIKSDIDRAAQALSCAKRKRLHIFIATSDIHLENKLKITRAEAIDKIRENVSYAAGLGIFDEIEFSCEDATRTERDFLALAVKTAVNSGAGIINIPDTVGYALPDEFASMLRALREKVPGNWALSAHCHNDLGLATANTLAAIGAGAEYVECTVNGLGERAGNASFEEIVMALKVRRDLECCEFAVKTPEILETSRLVASLSGVPVSPNKAIVGVNAFSHASGIHQHGVMQARGTYEIMDPADIGLNSNTIVLGKLSGRHAFADRAAALGYSLDEGGIDAAFSRFKEIADRRNVITDDDIRAIIGEYLDSLEGKYYLQTFQIQSGNHMKAMALITLKDKSRNGEEILLTEAAPGEGPIDAAFNAINRIAGADNVSLYSYGIDAVTEGTDALGEAKVEIRDKNGSSFTGRGVSADIIKASIKAYLGAINKWLKGTGNGENRGNDAGNDAGCF